MLQYYGLEDAYDKVREWYFGYHFVEKILYCPWDIVSYCADHHELTDTQCKNYWIDAIGNDMISQIVDQFWNQSWNWKLESLVNGEPLLLDSHNYFCRLYASDVSNASIEASPDSASEVASKLV